MSRSLNKVMLIGNVGTEPEIRSTTSGIRTAKLSLATNRRQKEGEEWVDVPEWHNLDFFDRLADVVEQWVKKGDRLYVEGQIRYSKYQDKEGVERYWTSIAVKEMVMLSPRGGDNYGDRGAPEGEAAASSSESGSTEPIDDLPF